jgi:hypothetical protein
MRLNNDPRAQPQRGFADLCAGDAAAAAASAVWVLTLSPSDHGALNLAQIPDGVELRVGTTGSVLVMTGTANGDDDRPVPAVPQALQ